ncbi:phage regulatory CII family protein [Aeromonas caviae]|uniref:phage regulatory CII family protein n=1 Tax=Aeromonas caviae TaxID=648 RepID=UPI0029DE0F47|nr:phage regulatory CII family protein [Aeromonas caviae]MDX7735851.1 phage regulatory CII family protein [Aeromonas caviae]
MTEAKKTTTRVKRDHSHLSDPIDAAYQMSRRYNITELAKLMGNKRPTTLNNKFNPACEDHHLTLSEAMAVTELTGDNAILQAWALSRGHVLVALPDSTVSEEELADQVMTVTSVVGAVFGELHLARQDGVIDPIERQAITAAVHRAIRELLSLEESVASQVRPLPVAVQGGAK